MSRVHFSPAWSSPPQSAPLGAQLAAVLIRSPRPGTLPPFVGLPRVGAFFCPGSAGFPNVKHLHPTETTSFRLDCRRPASHRPARAQANRVGSCCDSGRHGGRTSQRRGLEPRKLRSASGPSLDRRRGKCPGKCAPPARLNFLRSLTQRNQKLFWPPRSSGMAKSNFCAGLCLATLAAEKRNRLPRLPASGPSAPASAPRGPVSSTRPAGSSEHSHPSALLGLRQALPAGKTAPCRPGRSAPALGRRRSRAPWEDHQKTFTLRWVSSSGKESKTWVARRNDYGKRSDLGANIAPAREKQRLCRRCNECSGQSPSCECESRARPAALGGPFESRRTRRHLTPSGASLTSARRSPLLSGPRNVSRETVERGAI